MNKKLIFSLEDFQKFKQEQIEEYRNSYAPAARTTKDLETPKYFPVVVVYDDFDDSDEGRHFLYEFVYMNDFEM